LDTDEHGSKNQVEFKDKKQKPYWTRMNTDEHGFKLAKGLKGNG
jgi:hypothetical protein